MWSRDHGLGLETVSRPENGGLGLGTLGLGLGTRSLGLGTLVLVLVSVSDGVLETAVSARGSLETGFSKSRLGSRHFYKCLGLGSVSGPHCLDLGSVSEPHCLGLGSVSDPTVSGAGQLVTWSYGQL